MFRSPHNANSLLGWVPTQVHVSEDLPGPQCPSRGDRQPLERLRRPELVPACRQFKAWRVGRRRRRCRQEGVRGLPRKPQPRGARARRRRHRASQCRARSEPALLPYERAWSPPLSQHPRARCGHGRRGRQGTSFAEASHATRRRRSPRRAHRSRSLQHGGIRARAMTVGDHAVPGDESQPRAHHLPRPAATP